MATKRKLTGLRRPECDMCPNRALFEVKTVTTIRHFCGPCFLLLTIVDKKESDNDVQCES